MIGFRKCGAWSVRAAVRALFVSLMLLVAHGCESSSTDIEYLEKAKDYLDQGNLEASVIELKNSLIKNPGNPEARWLLGKTYLQLGDPFSAEKELQRAVELGIAPEAAAIPLAEAILHQREYKKLLDTVIPVQGLADDERAILLSMRGQAHLALRDFEAADQEFNAALTSVPGSAPANVGKARLELIQGYNEEGHARLDRVLQTDPEFAPAWSLLGDIESHKDRFKEAEDAYSKSIEFEPGNAEDHLKRALIRIRLKEYESAAADIKAIPKYLHEQPVVNYAKGLLTYYAQQDYAEARAAFERVLVQEPNHAGALLFLGASLSQLDSPEQADEYLTRLLERNPDHNAAARLLAAVRLQREDYESAIVLLQSVIEQNPQDVIALELLGEIRLRQGRSDEGVSYFRKVVAQQADIATSQAKLSIGLLLEGEHDDSIEAMERAVELEPELGRQGQFLAIVNYLKAKEFDKAIEEAKRLHEEYPDSPHPLTLMGGAYLGKGDSPKARDAFRRALEVSPGDSQAAANLARLELRDGNMDEARAVYEDIIKQSPGDLNAQIQLARLYATQDDMESAKKRLLLAIETHPGALQPRVILSGYYLRTGEPAEVFNVLTGLDEAYSDHPSVLGAIGEAQLATGAPESALTTFRRLVKVLPESERAHYLLSKAYAETGQIEQARTEVETALELRPDYLAANLTMIRLLRITGKADEASARLEDVRKTHPSNPDLLFEASQIALQQNRPGDAEKDLKAALAIGPTSKLTVNLAIAQWQAGKHDASIKTLRQWLESQPDDISVQYHLANTYLLAGRDREASDAFERLLELSPGFAPALNNLAWLSRERDPATARRYAEQAVEANPGMAEALDTLGFILLEQGEAERGLQYLKLAFKRAPNNPEIGYHLAMALSRTGDPAAAQNLLRNILATEEAFAGRPDAELLLRELKDGSGGG